LEEDEKKIILTVLVSAMLFSSCGVMFGGSKYRGSIYVNNNPQAEIYTNGEKLGVGKADRLFPRNQPLNIELRQKGCDPQVKNYYPAFRTGNFILSFLSFGLIGIGVDIGTGAAYKPDHQNYPDVSRATTNNFIFNLTYEGCPAKP